jgi:hypothetical protein
MHRDFKKASTDEVLQWLEDELWELRSETIMGTPADDARQELLDVFGCVMIAMHHFRVTPRDLEKWRSKQEMRGREQMFSILKFGALLMSVPNSYWPDPEYGLQVKDEEV